MSNFLIDCTISTGIAQGTMIDNLMKQPIPVRFEIIDKQKIYMYETRQTLFQKQPKEVLWTFTRTMPPTKQEKHTTTTQKNQPANNNSVESQDASCSENITNKR